MKRHSIDQIYTHHTRTFCIHPYVHIYAYVHTFIVVCMLKLIAWISIRVDLTEISHTCLTDPCLTTERPMLNVGRRMRYFLFDLTHHRRTHVRKLDRLDNRLYFVSTLKSTKFKWAKLKLLHIMRNTKEME